MIVRKMRKHDTQSMNKWLAQRGLNIVTEKSASGYIVPGVCAAQYLRCEAGTIIFDSLISNNLVSEQLRDKALDTLVCYMMEQAKEEGFTRILAFTTNGKVLERAQRHGFIHTSHALLAFEDKSWVS